MVPIEQSANFPRVVPAFDWEQWRVIRKTQWVARCSSRHVLASYWANYEHGINYQAKWQPDADEDRKQQLNYDMDGKDSAVRLGLFLLNTFSVIVNFLSFGVRRLFDIDNRTSQM